MALFGKREKVFEVWGDAPRWKAARAALKQQGIKIMESGFYDTEAPICGCGAKLDHRDFGPNGPIDRHTYYPLCPAGGCPPGKGPAGQAVKSRHQPTRHREKPGDPRRVSRFF